MMQRSINLDQYSQTGDMTMTNDFLKNFDIGAMGNIEKISAINIETMEKLAAIQLSLTNLNVASTVAQVRLVSNTTEPQALIEAETALVKGYGEQLVKIGGETSAILTDSREKLVKFAKESFASPVTEKTAKPASKKTKSSKKVAKKATRKVSKKAA